MLLSIFYVVSKRFKPDVNVVQVWDLNFVQRLEIFVHYVGQLSVSQWVLGCVPSYTSYQDSVGALTTGSPLLSYLDVCLPGFLPNGARSNKAQHLGPRRVREGSFEPIIDGLANIVFHGRAKHVPIESPCPS